MKYIIDTAKIYHDNTIEYDNNGKELPKKVHLFVEMDGFSFDSSECDDLKEFFQQIRDYKRDEPIKTEAQLVKESGRF